MVSFKIYNQCPTCKRVYWRGLFPPEEIYASKSRSAALVLKGGLWPVTCGACNYQNMGREGRRRR